MGHRILACREGSLGARPARQDVAVGSRTTSGLVPAGVRELDRVLARTTNEASEASTLDDVVTVVADDLLLGLAGRGLQILGPLQLEDLHALRRGERPPRLDDVAALPMDLSHSRILGPGLDEVRVLARAANHADVATDRGQNVLALVAGQRGPAFDRTQLVVSGTTGQPVADSGLVDEFIVARAALDVVRAFAATQHLVGGTTSDDVVAILAVEDVVHALSALDHISTLAAEQGHARAVLGHQQVTVLGPDDGVLIHERHHRCVERDRLAQLGAVALGRGVVDGVVVALRRRPRIDHRATWGLCRWTALLDRCVVRARRGHALLGVGDVSRAFEPRPRGVAPGHPGALSRRAEVRGVVQEPLDARLRADAACVLHPLLERQHAVVDNVIADGRGQAWLLVHR